MTGIPEAALEAAAAAHLTARGEVTWADLTPRGREDRLHWMRAALEAATPHMPVAVHWSAEDEAANAKAADEWAK